ncbi:nucleophile aminohydrolase [Syncephalastrum racemosum]|uniref:Nucleophile aminohydrolase n=1 Tax=Syncephalastrum racemosum TaxID=13706 RepID=A0A1X2HVE6_SYNRA|nr:nucleophile aminohydrolase [Syncephalastrum racemosum]
MTHSDNTATDALPFISRRSVVYGTNGMVSSSQPLATAAGVEILRKGGNAADAAVAVAAALNVTEPMSTGIGGDAFCLFYNAKDKKVHGLNGSGRSPAALTLDVVRKDENGVELTPNSVHSVTVPGAAASWVDTVEYFGSGKIDLNTILQPAIDMAENGFPVSHISADLWKEAAKDLLECNPGKKDIDLLLEGKYAPAEGDIISYPNLAQTFRQLAAEGKDGFYKGRIAESIVNAVQSRGGTLTLEDMANHCSEIVEPISVDYHDWTVWEIPPNGSGLTALIALGILQELEKQHNIDFTKVEHNSPEYLHIIIEAVRLAYADGRHYVSDPNVVPVPTKGLLSKEYLAERAKLINLDSRNNAIERGFPESNGNTVYFSVVDGEGNACSFINSLFMHFGSHIVPDNCGFALHNRGHQFVLIDGHPNCIGPNKRPYHTIIPSMITRRQKDGSHELEACFGNMGGFMQPQAHVQLVMNMMHYKFQPQHSVDMPRFCISPPPAGHSPPCPVLTDVNDSVVYIEQGIPDETIQALEQRGHKCILLKNHERKMFGRGQIIRVKKDKLTGKRVLAAGSDPRGDGHACGW